MKKKSRLYYNTIVALINQAVVLLCNFILPRQILISYGSEVNGLVTSITQFLGFITLMDMGIGAVVQSTLYKPLAERNQLQISKILRSARNFFNKIGIVLLIYVGFLCVFYPQLNSTIFGYGFIVPLIIAISISSIVQYFFGIINQLLLNADQRSYVQLTLNAVSLILNTTVSILLMKNGYSIQSVKLVASIVLLIKPIGMDLFVKKYYKIERKIVLYEEPIKQKWNGIAQHIASYILSNTDVLVLTLFSSMKNISIYNVYYIVVAGVRQCITTLMTGVDALFGNLYAKKDKKLNVKFGYYEWLMHTGVALVFTITAILICPFISVYTRGVDDTNYIYPVFGILLVAAYGGYSIRLPYNTMVLAAGHYKETQVSAIIEALLNIVISVIFVFKFGLYGVAIGTLVAMIYRTVYLAYYLKKAILFRPFRIFVKHIVVDLLSILVIYFSTKGLITEVSSYFSWVILAIRITLIGSAEVCAINLIFYKNECKMIFRKIIRKK